MAPILLASALNRISRLTLVHERFTKLGLAPPQEFSTLFANYYSITREGKKEMLTIGIRGDKTLRVDASMTAKAVGSGGLPVLATPTMIALMEATAMESVLPYLNEGTGTVGTEIHVRHLSATPVGLAVRCRSELIAVDGRKLTFSIEAHDEAGLIGTASHERFLIDNDRFVANAQKKRSNAQE